MLIQNNSFSEGNTSLSWGKYKRPWLAKQIQCTLTSIMFHCGKDGIDFVITRLKKVLN